MKLTQRLKEFNKGVNLGTHLIEGKYSVGTFKVYIENQENSNIFQFGFNSSSFFREHINYKKLRELTNINHKEQYKRGKYTKLNRNGTTGYPFK